MRALIAIALACCVGLAYAASEPLIDKGERAPGAYGLSKNNQRGTRDNPLVVEARSPELSDAKAKQEQADKDEHAHAESLIAISTAVLAAITGILAVATIVLGYFTFKLWRETKTLRENAAKDAEAQADNTGKTLAISGLQTDLMEKQKEIQRLQFLATHRPKVIVRQMGWDGPGHPGNADGTDALPVIVRFQMVNRGNVTAHVTAANITLVPINPLQVPPMPFPGMRPVDVTNNVRFNLNVANGQVLDYQSPDITLKNREDWLRMIERTYPVYVVGFLKYDDGAGSEYRTHFLRVLDPAKDRFFPADDPDYEYQD